jgi:hypothetical protein
MARSGQPARAAPAASPDSIQQKQRARNVAGSLLLYTVGSPYWLAAAGSAAEASDFIAFFFFGFFTCFSVGAEYDVAGLACSGAAGWANDGCASAATPKAVNINISFFI